MKKYNLTILLPGRELILGQITENEVIKFITWYNTDTTPVYIQKCTWGDSTYTAYIVREKVSGWHVK